MNDKEAPEDLFVLEDENENTSIAIFFIEGKSVFIEKDAFPEYAVKYVYEMIRAREQIKVEPGCGKTTLRYLFKDDLSAFVDRNKAQIVAQFDGVASFQKHAYELVYLYHLDANSIIVNELDDEGINEIFKGSLFNYVTQYTQMLKSDLDLDTSEMVSIKITNHVRDFISKDAIDEWKSLLEVLRELPAKEENWDQDALKFMADFFAKIKRSQFSTI